MTFHQPPLVNISKAHVVSQAHIYILLGVLLIDLTANPSS